MEHAIDRDTREVIDLLRDAVATSGLSQAAFARALGTSAPRLSTYLSGATRPSAHFCMRARRIGRALGAARAHGLMSAPVTAAAMREQLRNEDVSWVWRMLLQARDHLAKILASGDQVLIDSWEADPGDCGSAEWTTLLAALTTHTFEDADLEPPAWAQAVPLEQPWMPAHPFLSPDRVRAATPEWLSQLNLYVPGRDLVTA